jgi:hypothetical protein
MIAPIIVEKLVKIIFDKNEVIEIGGVEFDKEGYHKQPFFGKRKSVFWRDEQIFKPQIYQMNVILYKEKNGEGRHLASISLEDMNAFVIPWLLEACIEEYYLREQG